MRKEKTKARKGVAKGRGMRWLPSAAVALVTLAAAIGYSMKIPPTPAQLQAAEANCSLEGYRRAEPRPPLSPALFGGRAHAAYAYAMAIPAVMDQLSCYCHCEENMGHKNLLSCYTDTHGANCNVCLTEAEIAAKMTVEGLCPDAIQQAIDRRFG